MPIFNFRRSLGLFGPDLPTLFGVTFPTVIAGFAMYLAVLARQDIGFHRRCRAAAALHRDRYPYHRLLGADFLGLSAVIERQLKVCSSG
jgi:uncharacterized protein (DUF934 family)